MVPSPEWTVAEWREYLRDYSAEFLQSQFLRTAEEDDRAQWMLNDTQRAAGWLGYESAGGEAIHAAEERLGVTLPPSYKNFLLASNGWSTMAYSLDLLKVEEIGWFGELEGELLAAWSDPGMEHFAEQITLLKRCLLISGPGDGDYWALSADDVAENGEWTAYEWWAGDGEDPYPRGTFAGLVASLMEKGKSRFGS